MRSSALVAILLALSFLLALQVSHPPAAETVGQMVWIPLAYGPAETITPTTTPTSTPTIEPARVRVDSACSQFNAPGDDNKNPTEEYVCFENYGSRRVDMTGWAVHDEVRKRYTFPSFGLGSKASVKLRTGKGVDTDTDLYVGAGSAIWNNDGDTVYLYDSEGRLVDQYTYTSAPEKTDESDGMLSGTPHPLRHRAH